MRLPDFLVVGTARAGTTALHYYLRQHPQLFLPRQKEPCFFCFYGKPVNYKLGKFSFAITGEKEYLNLFKGISRNQIAGEISTPYLFLHQQTIKNIQHFYSGRTFPSIIIILRNPIERAYSQYLWKVRDGREELSFDDALKMEKKRIRDNFSFDYFYASRGLYYESVKNYLHSFKNIKIFLYEDFKSDAAGTLSSLCSFIGADRNFNFEQKENQNASGMPKFSAWGRIMTVESKFKFRILGLLPDRFRSGIREQFIRWNSTGNPPPPISAEARKFLKEYYSEDVKKLQSLTGIDLSVWKM